MTLEELEQNLPIGLHDAQLVGIAVDYEKRSAALDIAADVSELTEQEPRYRRLRIKISGLVFLVIDPPEERYLRENAKEVMVDAGPGHLARSVRQRPSVWPSLVTTRVTK